MPENTSPSFASRTGGVRHSPEADIESIRGLLRGYGSGASILKELIQNAEDAGASRMDVLYLPGSQIAPHTLLCGPSLLVINDGDFKPAHRDAITQINMGTKGTEERAIGRFGKGLKSVFAWCEAFFIIARTDPQWGWQEATIADLFNPWHGWRHEDWETEFEQQAEVIAGKAKEHFSNIYSADKPWLAFWFPLRRQQQAEDEWIEQQFPGDDANFWQALVKELRELAPSLVILRNLNSLALLNCNGNAGDSHVLKFLDGSDRIPAPDTDQAGGPVAGTITLTRQSSELAHHFRGVAGRLQNAEGTHLKQQDGWPKVVQRTNGFNKASVPVKGEPHFASLLTWYPAQGSAGSLDLRWCVFFPVGKQPTGKERVPLASLKKHITINLHGFFFLDSDRLRIDGLEGQFKATPGNDRDTCIAWNQLIATQGVLANLPKALHDFAQAENLPATECLNLAEAMCQTWEWECFKSDICRQVTWRPRWRAGEETWECLPATTSVLPIPAITNSQELLSCLPMLSPISEEQVLVTKAAGGTMRGLHNSSCDRWSEGLLVRLFSNVKVSATGNESTIQWINSFLAELKQTNCLTQGIYDLISTLPLLTVNDARTHTPRFISVQEWETLCKNDQIFAIPKPGEKWLELLCKTFPENSFAVSDNYLPQWFTGTKAPPCTETVAAHVVLNQSDSGSFPARTKLWEAFTALPSPGPLIVRAMRYLMHADRSHAQDETTNLWIPAVAPDQQIWARLFHHLHQEKNGAKPWQLLSDSWKDRLSQDIQRKLKIVTMNAEGAWQELQNNQDKTGALEFPLNEWSDEDIATLLQGLYKTGKPKSPETLKLLRQLRVYKLTGNSELRVSVADSNGQLDDHYVLHTQDFEAGIPADLRPIWQAFLAETKIIERFPSDILAGDVQEQIFQRSDEQGTPYPVKLDWSYVVRRCLEAEEPGKRAALILQAFAKQGSQAASGLTEKLRKIKWLPLKLGEYIDPDSVVYIEGFDEDLHQLLDPVKDGLAGIHALSEQVNKHPGFKTLSSYFPRSKETFEMLGLWMDEKPNWHLGLTKEFQIVELQPLLAQLKDFETLPIANLLVKLCSLSEGNLVPLIQEYILPAVLKKFDYEQEGINKIKDILCRLQSSKSREAFDAYLQQTCRDSIIRKLLPELYLVNQRCEWKSARQLIWPSENLDPAVQLCDEQAKILSPLHDESAKHESPAVGKEQGLTQTRGNQLLEPPDFDAQVEKLNEYLRPFEAGNVGVNLMSALIAVLGGHPGINALLQKLLQTGMIGQSPEVFLSRLFGEQGESLFTSPERFLIDIVRTSGIETYSLTNEPLTVALTDEIKTLIVGNPNDLWFNYFYKNQCCHILRLRWIEDPDSLPDLVNVFAKTVETIYLKVHCNGVASSCPSNLKETLTDIADAGQVALRRSQLYLLDMAEARLRELGVKGMPQFQGILQEFDDARQARVDAEDLSVQAPPKAQHRRKQADEKRRSATDRLVKLLGGAESADVRHELVQAVRRKMTDFQYSLASVLQELFQNADDAVAEWKEMRQTLDPLQGRFVLCLSKEKNILEIFHWGRPINQYESPGFTAGRNRGYDQDLVKMLTLNFSDKGVGKEAGQAIVTGLFGLGFKSVFFVAEEPQVISGRLAFEIRGGFYPILLAPEAATELRQKAEQLGNASITPTVIRLRWKNEDGLAAELKQAVDKFMRIAPLLTIFSRHLQTLRVSDDDENNDWKNAEQPLTKSGQVTYSRVGNHLYLCFRCLLASEQYPATILFQLNPDGITPLEDDLTGLWITTPTAERSQMRWALNAPFKPDAGRQQLPLTNRENKSIAEKAALTWGKALIDLFDETENDWQSIKSKLNLHGNVNAMKWWQQLWQETTRDAPILQWNDVREGGQVLHWIAWGESVGAMRRLIEERRAIPSDLPGEHEKMLKLSEVKYVLNGVLAKTDNGCFAQIESWDTFRSAFPPGQTVGQKTGDHLRLIIPDLSLEPLTLRNVLATEIGVQNHVSPTSTERIGTLLEKCKAVFEMYSPVWYEDGLRDWITQLLFLAQDGSYRPASELVCSRPVTDLIEKDEALRADFAPESAVLSPDYSDTSLHFFIKARGKLSANTERLAEWAQDASLEKLPAVFNYLVSGEIGQGLADKLGRDWLDEKKVTVAFKKLSEEQRSEIERKFAKGMPWPPQILLPYSPDASEEQVRQVMDSKEAFRLVSEWWGQEQEEYIVRYEADIYPSGFPGKLHWPGEDAWDEECIPSSQSRWLMLFVHAALVPLGFNKIGRDQSFSQFLVSRNLLDILPKTSNTPEVLLRALDQWLDSFIQNPKFHLQMRQFIAFYAVARNLEGFLESLRAADIHGETCAFENVFSPKANPILIGTGITAPPITGMLGMGSCQLLRELYRLGRLSNPAGFPYAFMPLQKVRRLCTQLFGTEYQSNGARSSLGIFAELQRLGSKLDLDPTFNRCFDLPFQFLAENEPLCRKVLGQPLNGGPSMMGDFDFQSDLEDFYGTDALS